MAVTKTPSIEEAERALARARQVEAERAAEAEAEAEAEAQAEHDRAHERLVADIEREAGDAIAAASMPSRIDRGASAAARIFLYSLPSPSGQFGDDRLSLAVRNDPPAAALRGLFESVTATHNKLTVNRPQGTRRISIELGERLCTVERRVWGNLIKRLRTVAGEE